MTVQAPQDRTHVKPKPGTKTVMQDFVSTKTTLIRETKFVNRTEGSSSEL